MENLSLVQDVFLVFIVFVAGLFVGMNVVSFVSKPKKQKVTDWHQDRHKKLNYAMQELIRDYASTKDISLGEVLDRTVYDIVDWTETNAVEVSHYSPHMINS